MKVERFHPVPVACGERGLCSCIPNDEREHSYQPVKSVRAPVLYRGKQDLGVRPRPELMLRFELAAELEVVVYLAVQNDLKIAVRACQRLPPRGREIDDTQPIVGEPAHAIRIQVQTFSIGSAM